jgi:hypothetical protein
MKSLVAIAIVAIMGISMAGCGETPGGQDNGHLIMGKFSNQGAGIDAIFYADIASGRSARSVAAGQELTGKIEDGNIIFNLTGVYFSSDGTFVLSAGSSFLVYEISGTVTSNGIQETQALVKVLSGSDWTIIEIPVIVVNEVDITGSASGEQSDGLPTNWHGVWTFQNFHWTYNGYPCDECGGECEGHPEPFDSVLVITPFGMTNTWDDGTAFPVDILEVTRISDTKFDLVVQGEEGGSGACSDYPCGDDDCCYDYHYMVYIKIRLEQTSPNLLMLIIPYGSGVGYPIDEPGALENARAIDLDTTETLALEMTR